MARSTPRPKRAPWRWLGSLVLVSTVLVPARAPAFQPGDYYSADTHRVLDTCAATGVISRIDPTTYAVTEIFVDTNGSAVPNLNSSISYDAYRDRIVFYEETGAAPDFSLLSDTGSASSLPDPANVGWNDSSGGFSPAPTPQTSPAGDGRIFLMARDIDDPSFWRFQYWDATDTLHEILDQTGASPYTYTPAGGAFLFAITYDAGANALLFTEGVLGSTTIHKATLSADGTRVTGTVESTTFSVSTTLNRPIQWSHGPGSRRFLLVDTNSNGSEPRLNLIDPVGLTHQPFATQSGGTVAAQTSGFYHPALGAAIVRLNTDLRRIDPGETGNGTLLAAGVFCAAHPYLIRIAGPRAVPALHGAGHAALFALLLGLGLGLALRRSTAVR